MRPCHTRRSLSMAWRTACVWASCGLVAFHVFAQEGGQASPGLQETTQGSSAAASAPTPSQPSAFAQALATAQALRAQGQFLQALRQLQAAQQLAADPQEQTWGALEAATLLLAARRLDQAQSWLDRAAQSAAGHRPLMARVALEQGNLHALRRDRVRAQTHYQQALTLEDPAVHATVAMNLLRLNQRHNLLAQAPTIRLQIDRITEPALRAAMLLRLANLAQGIEYTDTRRLVFDSASAALRLGREHQLRRITVSALDVLAQLYEADERIPEGLDLIRQALVLTDPSKDQDLLINLHWHRGRLERARQNQEQALDAYLKAVEFIDAIRFDIPVTYDDGRSSFRETLEPIYLGLTDLLLRQAPQQPEQSAVLLRRARNAAEGIKQSELQDYLGDQCTVASARQSDVARGLPADTAVLYPVIFEDRVETIVETRAGLAQARSVVPGYELRRLAHSFAAQLRNHRPNYQGNARQLFDILIAPVLPELERTGVSKLVVVPDGVLRLVPYGALHDGAQFLVDRFAVSVSPSLGVTQTNAPAQQDAPRILVSGLADPGPVVDILLKRLGTDLLAPETPPAAPSPEAAGETSPSVALLPDSACGGRYAQLLLADASDALQPPDPPVSDSGPRPGAAPWAPLREAADPAVRMRELREIRLREAARSLGQSLRLPGVVQEVANVAQGREAEVLLDQQFTLDNFSRALASGRFNTVHIASHGVFGGTGDSSYLLAWDQLITMDALQALIKSDRLAKKPIDLISLSACETAEGDDRAPLGISGAALKARARSVVGTLWPVADEAAQQLMIRFYEALGRGQSKTEALREAQQALLAQPTYRHPFYWAPFTLAGAWQ